MNIKAVKLWFVKMLKPTPTTIGEDSDAAWDIVEEEESEKYADRAMDRAISTMQHDIRVFGLKGRHLPRIVLNSLDDAANIEDVPLVLLLEEERIQQALDRRDAKGLKTSAGLRKYLTVTIHKV